MAELMVAAAIGALASATITEVVKRSFTFLGHQLSLMRGVHDMMDKIKMDLMSIQSLLCLADQKMNQQKQVRGGESTDDLLVVWVKKVRNVAYKLQIILDTHMYGISNRGEDGVVQRYRRKLRILATYRETAVELEKIGPSVKEIMDKYDSLIHQKLSSYLSDVCESSSSFSKEPRNVSLTRNRFSEDDVFFSLNEKGDSQKDIIEKWILEQPVELANIVTTTKLDVRWMCIALWGMGGLGKTTLLRQIYYHNIPLMKQFNCTAWVTVSKTYKVVDLLRDMIKELASSSNLDTSSKSEEELISIVHGILAKKRYLIVFDDVWQDDFWSKIEYIFSKDHDRRSRILFTTRDKNVALSVAKENRVMELQTLQEKEAWLLFCKEAFWQEIESQCPPELEEWAKKIVGKCGGLPLAIVAAAGMMSKIKKNTSDWERSYRMLSSQLSDNPKLSILMHSYYALPSYLKKCFLHLCTFPEDYGFSMDTICRLWVAEGFIEEKGGMTLEEVTEGYLNELLQRSMIQQIEDQFFRISYRVHDTFRMMALDMIDQISATILDGEHRNTNDCRRLNVHKYEEGYPAIVNQETLCSLYFFCQDIPTTMFSFQNFQLLKVLHFKDTMLSNIPEEIFNLFNLQYLNFRNTRIKVDIFPRKLARLQNLQYLDLMDSNVQQLPPDVINLHKLRHLFFGNFKHGRGFQAHMDISKLTDLQDLNLVEANEKFVKKLGQLEQLRILGITNVKQSHEKSLCDSLKRLRHLKRLEIHISNGELIDLELLSFSSSHLQEFYLYGGLKSIPTCFRSPNNLKHVGLCDSKLQLKSDPLECLRSLPYLEYLFLQNSHETTKIIFPPNCFPSLRYLYIGWFSNLTSIEIDKAALPVLRVLVMKVCVLLTKPLPRVENLQNLQELVLTGMPSDVMEYFQEICGKCTNLKLTISP